jgi:hypothetical protein
MRARGEEVNAHFDRLSLTSPSLIKDAPQQDSPRKAKATARRHVRRREGIFGLRDAAVQLFELSIRTTVELLVVLPCKRTKIGSAGFYSRSHSRVINRDEILRSL